MATDVYQQLLEKKSIFKFNMYYNNVLFFVTFRQKVAFVFHILTIQGKSPENSWNRPDNPRKFSQEDNENENAKIIKN